MIRILFLSLGVTLAAELLVAFLWKLPAGGMRVVFGANLLTNPLFVVLMLTARLYLPYRICRYLHVGAEVAVILAEGLVYQKKLPDLARPYAFSLTANLCSILVGSLTGV